MANCTKWDQKAVQDTANQEANFLSRLPLISQTIKTLKHLAFTQ